MKFLNLKSILTTLGIIFISLFILTILSYFDLINDSTFNIFQIMFLIISFFIGGFLTGRNTDTKGWLEGLKFGMFFVIIFLILNLIIFKDFKISSIIYYLILIISSSFGSMIGISKKLN